MTKNETRCPVCGRRDTKIAYINGYVFHRCDHCFVMFESFDYD